MDTIKFEDVTKMNIDYIVNEMDAVRKVIGTIEKAESQDELFQSVMDVLVDKLGVVGGMIYILNDETGEADLFCSRGLEKEFTDSVARIKLNDFIYGDNSDGYRPLLTEDYGEVDSFVAERFGIRSVFALPMIIEEKTIGALWVTKMKEPFSKQEVGKIMVLANSLGFAFCRLESKKGIRIMNQNLSSLFNNMDELIFVLGMDGRILEINDTVSEKLGIDRNDLIGKSVLDVHFSEMRNDALRIVSEMTFGETLFCPLPLKKKNGDILEVETRVLQGVWNGEKVFFEISKDLTDTIELERIRYINEHDELTGLLNRGAFEKKLREQIDKKNCPMTVVLFDINGFRIVNDVYGHEQGDAFLKAIARHIENEYPGKKLVARWCGDSFALLLMDTDEPKALEIAERIKLKAKLVNKGGYVISLSFGISTLKNCGSSGEKAIAEAEEMMRRHKLFVENSVQNSLIVSIQKTISERNLETEEHTERMVEVSEGFAECLGLDKNETNSLKLLATLHDIGKIGIPDNVLLKDGPLDDIEWEIMKKHSIIGCRIVGAINNLSHMEELILHHHEKWDGSGYPGRLRGEDIPKLCRILALIDAYDVMTHERPYKGPVSESIALLEIKRCGGTQFDPELAESFVDFMNEKNGFLTLN